MARPLSVVGLHARQPHGAMLNRLLATTPIAADAVRTFANTEIGHGAACNACGRLPSRQEGHDARRIEPPWRSESGSQPRTTRKETHALRHFQFNAHREGCIKPGIVPMIADPKIRLRAELEARKCMWCCRPLI